MSLSIVKKSLELFEEDERNAEKKNTGKNKSDTKVVTVHSNKNTKRKEKQKLKKKLADVKKPILTAFDEHLKYETTNRCASNLQFMRDIASLAVANDKTVEKIIKHQNGKLAKNNRPAEKEAKADQGSIFTDRDFDKFEEEYVF